MNPQLTCCQRQWLHSSVGRASPRYREVTGSNPVEVLNFFSGFFTQLHKLCSLPRSFLHFQYNTSLNPLTILSVCSATPLSTRHLTICSTYSCLFSSVTSISLPPGTSSRSVTYDRDDESVSMAN